MIPANLDDVMSVRNFARRYPDLGKSEKAIRWDIYNASHNGLNDFGAVLRVGRRTLIHVPSYRDWLFSHRQGGQK